MKVRSSIRRICSKCFFVKRKRVNMIMCFNSKHKQRQG